MRDWPAYWFIKLCWEKYDGVFMGWGIDESSDIKNIEKLRLNPKKFQSDIHTIEKLHEQYLGLNSKETYKLDEKKYASSNNEIFFEYGILLNDYWYAEFKPRFDEYKKQNNAEKVAEIILIGDKSNKWSFPPEEHSNIRQSFIAFCKREGWAKPLELALKSKDIENHLDFKQMLSAYICINNKRDAAPTQQSGDNKLLRTVH